MNRNFRRNGNNRGFTNTYQKSLRLSQTKTYNSDIDYIRGTTKLLKQMHFYGNLDIFMPTHPIPQ